MELIGSIISLSFPYSQQLLEELLDEFDWKFGSAEKEHLPTTGNCNHIAERWDGNLSEGMYQNASAACSYCYPGSNPAILTWEDESLGDGKITLSVHPVSSKVIRALGVFTASTIRK